MSFHVLYCGDIVPSRLGKGWIVMVLIMSIVLAPVALVLLVLAGWALIEFWEEVFTFLALGLVLFIIGSCLYSLLDGWVG